MLDLQCLLVCSLAGAMLFYAVTVVALYLGGHRHRAMKRISTGAVLVSAAFLGGLAAAGRAEFLQRVGQTERRQMAEPALAMPIRGAVPTGSDLSCSVADF
jgi:hypothetical protein